MNSFDGDPTPRHDGDRGRRPQRRPPSLDVVHSAGRGAGYNDEDSVPASASPPDTAPPVIGGRHRRRALGGHASRDPSAGARPARARACRTTGVRVVLKRTSTHGRERATVPMRRYGEYLWRADGRRARGPRTLSSRGARPTRRAIAPARARCAAERSPTLTRNPAQPWAWRRPGPRAGGLSAETAGRRVALTLAWL